jgi:hypothetical protein
MERVGEKRSAYWVWLEIPVKREYLEDPRRRWETNIKTYSIGFIWLTIETSCGLL